MKVFFQNDPGCLGKFSFVYYPLGQAFVLARSGILPPMSDYPVIPVLRLLRFPNLLVVALTQWLVYYRIIAPALAAEGIAGVLNQWKFVEILRKNNTRSIS